MIVELIVINQLTLPESKHKVGSHMIPRQIFQKKLFIIENLQIEEHMNSKGFVIPRYTTAKYDNEFYKLNHPYKELKKYYEPSEFKGFGK